MTSKEAREFLGISAATLNRRVKAKEITPINEKTPGQRRVPAYVFNKADVEKLAHAN